MYCAYVYGSTYIHLYMICTICISHLKQQEKSKSDVAHCIVQFKEVHCCNGKFHLRGLKLFWRQTDHGLF